MILKNQKSDYPLFLDCGNLETTVKKVFRLGLT